MKRPRGVQIVRTENPRELRFVNAIIQMAIMGRDRWPPGLPEGGGGRGGRRRGAGQEPVRAARRPAHAGRALPDHAAESRRGDGPGVDACHRRRSAACGVCAGRRRVFARGVPYLLHGAPGHRVFPGWDARALCGRSRGGAARRLAAARVRRGSAVRRRHGHGQHRRAGAGGSRAGRQLPAAGASQDRRRGDRAACPASVRVPLRLGVGADHADRVPVHHLLHGAAGQNRQGGGRQAA